MRLLYENADTTSCVGLFPKQNFGRARFCGSGGTFARQFGPADERCLVSISLRGQIGYRQGQGHEQIMSMAFDVKATRLAEIELQDASADIWDSKYRLKTK